MYMEASFPSQPGYEAILTFKNQFEGCICLEFMCNLWVNKNAKLEVKANGKLIKLIRDTGVGRGRPWEKESITINEPGLTTVNYNYNLAYLCNVYVPLLVRQFSFHSFLLFSCKSLAQEVMISEEI